MAKAFDFPEKCYKIISNLVKKLFCLFCTTKTLQGPQDWKGSVFIPILKKSNVKECSNYAQLHSSHTPVRRRQWHPTPVLLPGKSHGWRSLVGCSHWGPCQSDTTERLHFHFSLSCIGEGNGNPLQCSCLENPRDRAGWWAAIYGVAQSQTRLKRLRRSRRRMC